MAEENLVTRVDSLQSLAQRSWQRGIRVTEPTMKDLTNSVCIVVAVVSEKLAETLAEGVSEKLAEGVSEKLAEGNSVTEPTVKDQTDSVSIVVAVVVSEKLAEGNSLSEPTVKDLTDSVCFVAACCCSRWLREGWQTGRHGAGSEGSDPRSSDLRAV